MRRKEKNMAKKEPSIEELFEMLTKKDSTISFDKFRKEIIESYFYHTRNSRNSDEKAIEKADEKAIEGWRKRSIGLTGIIGQSFNWTGTEDGSDYWGMINNRWPDLLYSTYPELVDRRTNNIRFYKHKNALAEEPLREALEPAQSFNNIQGQL